MFSQYLGMSPKYFSEIIRIRKAISLILNSNHTISESSYALEFHDLSHFNYTFKKITGTTPKRYFAEPNELSNFFLVSKSEIPHKSVDILKLLSQLKLSD